MDPTLHDSVPLAVGGVASVALYVWDVRWNTASRRCAKARRWAERHVSSYDDAWLAPFEARIVISRFVACFVMFFSVAFLVAIPWGGQPYAALLLSVPALYSVLCGLFFDRVPLPRGTRVARLRELELCDYVPEVARGFMWVAAVVSFSACVLAARVEHAWFLGASAVLMLVAPMCVELGGRRLARQPEPAQSPAHLYLQDVIRADHLRGAALGSVLSSAFLCNWLSAALPSSGWLGLTLLAANIGLLAGLCVVCVKFGRDPAAYMRTRLWPWLGPAELLAKDERTTTWTTAP